MPNTAGIASINEILDHVELPDGDLRNHLLGALYQREDEMAEAMHSAGAQFGLFPQIVAEVLAELEFGTPKSTDERTVIRASYENLMEELRKQQQG